MAPLRMNPGTRDSSQRPWALRIGKACNKRTSGSLSEQHAFVYERLTNKRKAKFPARDKRLAVAEKQLGGRMSARDFIKSPAEIERQRKSPAHLLLLPVTLGVAGVCCYALVVSTCALAAGFRKEVHGFAGYAEPTKTLIVIPLLLASIPVGLIAANLLVWSIPPARRFFDREDQSRPNADFASSMRELLKFSKYWILPLGAVGVGAALFGK